MVEVSEGCTIETGDPDGPVVVHRAMGTHRRRRLAQAAHVYSAISHPGIIRIVAYSAGEESAPAELRTRFAGSRTLATSPPQSAATIAGTMAAVATTVGGMHDLGFTHGRLTADHIIVAAGGRPVLCGLGAGNERGDSPTSFSWRSACAKDCRDLGALTSHLLDNLDAAGRRPLAAWAERRRRRQLADVACHAAGDHTSATDLAKSFAALSGAELESAEIQKAAEADDPVDSDGADGGSLRRRRPSPLVASTVLIAAGCWLSISGLTSVVRSTEPAHEPAKSGCTTTLDRGRNHSGPRHGTHTGEPRCGPQITVRGRQITVGGYRYLVGKPGDIAQVGDWDGDGIDTPALLRPKTGEIFFFDRWPSAGHPVTVVARTHVSGATGLRLASGQTHTTQLIVTRARRLAVTVTMPTSAKDKPTP